MKYSIPYTPGIYDFLLNDQNIVDGKINDIYFSDNKLPSNRYFDWKDDYWEELKLINKQFNIALHYVINPSLYSNDFYDSEKIIELISIIEELKTNNVTIITMNNSILLRSQAIRDSLEGIELKNSVNNKIKTLEDVIFWVNEIKINSLIIDRSVNRNIDELARIHRYTSEHNIKLTLLANEGCLPDCVWKQHCDNMISQYHCNSDKVQHYKNIHGMLACTKHYHEKPVEALRSPFILPNNIEQYRSYADIIKIAGRMTNLNKLWDIIMAYIIESGNTTLYTFFATQISPFYQKITFNDLIELNFDEKTNNCHNKCQSCNYCDKVFDNLSNEKYGVKTNYANRKIFM